MSKLVYLLSTSDGEYKIGISTTKNLKKRIKTLETGNSSKIELVNTYISELSSLIERTLHREFGHKKIKGEWFDLSIDEVLTFSERCNIIESNINKLKEQDNYYIINLLKNR